MAVQGDKLSEVNRGQLCEKGAEAAGALSGSNRLTQPLLRKNGKLEPISWEEAIATVGSRIKADSAGFAFYGSGQSTIPEGYAASKFVKGGLGHNQIESNGRLCTASAVAALKSVYGVDGHTSCYDDLDHCTIAILWGVNAAETYPVLFSRLLDRRTQGENVTIIDIATRRTPSSDLSDRTLLFNPSTDLAIAIAIANILVSEEKYDKAFVEEHCEFRTWDDNNAPDGKAVTFDEYKRSLAEYTPEYVEQISGVAASDIRTLAATFADKSQRIVSLWSAGANQHTRGTALNVTLYAIHLLTGHFGKLGDAPTSLSGQSSECGTREVGGACDTLPGGLAVSKESDRRTAERIWNVPTNRISDQIGPHATDVWRQFSTPRQQGGNINTVWVQASNPARSLPNVKKLFDPSRQMPDKFLIVSDVYPSATALAADLVLPSAMWVEKNGMFGNAERRTQQWFQQVGAPGKARPEVWQILAVAWQLFEIGHAGMKDNDGSFLFSMVKDGKVIPVWDYSHFYDINVDMYLFEEYRKFSTHNHQDLAPYSEYVATRGRRWPVVQQRNGSWRETRRRFVEGDDPYVAQGKGVQFYGSPTQSDRAQICFHPYAKPSEMPDSDFPYTLTTGRVHNQWNTGPVTSRIPGLAAPMPTAYVEMNPQDANGLGVVHGEVVTVETRRGKLDLPVRLDRSRCPGVGSVFVPFNDESVPIQQLTLDALDSISNQPDYKKCAARVSKRHT